MSLTLSLPMPPSLNRLYRAVGGRSILSAEYRAWKAEAGLCALAQRARPVAGPVAVSVKAKPKDRRKRDIDNFGFKAVLDLLVAHKLIDADDSTCVRKITAEWVTEGDPCTVTVEAI